MENTLKKLAAELATKTDELNKVSAAYKGSSPAIPALEAELNGLIQTRAEARADAALGLPADETAINIEIARVESALTRARLADQETAAVDAVLQARANAIRNDIAGLQALILAERKGIMAIELENAEVNVAKAAQAQMEALMALEKARMVAQDADLVRDQMTLYRLPESVALPLMQREINIDFSRRGDIHNKVRQKLDEVLMN